MLVLPFFVIISNFYIKRGAVTFFFSSMNELFLFVGPCALHALVAVCLFLLS